MCVYIYIYTYTYIYIYICTDCLATVSVLGRTLIKAPALGVRWPRTYGQASQSLRLYYAGHDNPSPRHQANLAGALGSVAP